MENSELASLQEIKEITKKRFETIDLIINELDEETLNKQPLMNKRSIAELLDHILIYQSLGPSINRVLYFFLNIVTGSIQKAIVRPVDASDYEWNLTIGKNRKAKFIPKQKLMRKSEKVYNKEFGRIDQYQEKHLKTLHTVNRHLSCHLMQVIELLDQLKLRILENLP